MNWYADHRSKPVGRGEPAERLEASVIRWAVDQLNLLDAADGAGRQALVRLLPQLPVWRRDA